jgi:hypothetical protein
MRAFPLFAALLFVFAGASFGQTEAVTGEPVAEEVVTDPLPETSEFQVRVHEKRLSVELEEAAFGEVMHDIAEKAGFELELIGAISRMKLTTRFSDLELQRGIQRLFTLINQRNYFIHYDAEGNITKLEVLKSASAKPETRKATGYSPTTRPVRRRPVTTSEIRSRKLKPPVIFPDRLESEGLPGEEPEVPYIAPKKEPAYIPSSGNP